MVALLEVLMEQAKNKEKMAKSREEERAYFYVPDIKATKSSSRRRRRYTPLGTSATAWYADQYY